MKVLLMYRDRDFDLQQELPQHAAVLTQDLDLDTLLRAMAGKDEFLLDVARKALLSGLGNDVDTVQYRQAVAQDCLRNPTAVRELYALAVAAIEGKKKHYFGIFGNYPSTILHVSIDVLQMFVGMLKTLRGLAQSHASGFDSEGFRALFTMILTEFSDAYFASIQEHLAELKFRSGVLLSADLGQANEGTHHVLRLPSDRRPHWLRRLLGQGPPEYSFHLADRDESGARALSELQDRGINLVANALAQSMDHILSFFEMLRVEVGFYVGCLDLHERLSTLGAPICFPQPQAAGTRKLRFGGLYDVCLALSMGRSIVANDLGADRKDLVIITGANQGGKSSFLRSVGVAQLMMHAGMFVAAEASAGELCAGLFTHYKREEDATMKRGKLDEELSRMSGLADAITSNSMLLFNESFSSTNEREGSEIARQVVRALLDRRIKVFYVTHLYDFAHGLFDQKLGNATFLRANRESDGTRTFKLVDGEPSETSYGEDLYREVFAEEAP